MLSAEGPGVRTLLMTTDAILDCVFVENAPVSVVFKIGGHQNDFKD